MNKNCISRPLCSFFASFFEGLETSTVSTTVLMNLAILTENLSRAVDLYRQRIKIRHDLVT